MNKSSRKAIKQAVIAIAIIVVVVLGFITLAKKIESVLWPSREDVDVRNQTGSGTSEKVMINGRWYTKKPGLDTVLLIGSDGFANADFLMVLVSDNDNGKYTGIQINRDTMTKIPIIAQGGEQVGSDKTQIALSMKYGDTVQAACGNVASAVSYLLFDVDIDNYVALTMDAIPILNDEVGGVNVDGSGELSGDEALTYVRGRKGVDDGTNISRMNRQNKYMTEWFKKAREIFSDANSVAELLKKLDGCMVSNLTVNQLSNFAKNMDKYSDAEIVMPEGTNNTDGQFAEFYTDDEKLQDMVLDIFYDEVTE